MIRIIMVWYIKVAEYVMREKLIFIYVTVLHALWGTLLLSSPIVLKTVSLHALYTIIPQRWLLAGILWAATICGAYALVRMFQVNRTTTIDICLFVPQQMLLIMAAAGAVHAIITGHIQLDEALRSPIYLLSGLAPTILIAIFHTVAILDAGTGGHIWTMWWRRPSTL